MALKQGEAASLLPLLLQPVSSRSNRCSSSLDDVSSSSDDDGSASWNCRRRLLALCRGGIAEAKLGFPNNVAACSSLSGDSNDWLPLHNHCVAVKVVGRRRRCERWRVATRKDGGGRLDFRHSRLSSSSPSGDSCCCSSLPLLGLLVD